MITSIYRKPRHVLVKMFENYMKDWEESTPDIRKRFIDGHLRDLISILGSMEYKEKYLVYVDDDKNLKVEDI